MERAADLPAALRLIEAGYAAAVGDGPWGALLAAVGDAFGVRTSVSVMDVTGEGPPCPYAEGRGFDPLAVEQFHGRYSRVNPWQPPLKDRGVGFMDGASLVTREELDRSEYFNDWCRPWGVHDKSGVVMANDGRTNAALTIFMPELGPRDREVLDGTLAVAAPHLIRAYRIHEMLCRPDPADLPAFGAVSPAAAVVVCEPDGRILHAGPAAEAVLRRGDGLLAVGGRLRAADPRADDRLAAALGRAAGLAEGLSAGRAAPGWEALAVPRPPPGRPYLLRIAPRASAPAVGPAPSPLLLPRPGRLVVVIRDAGAPVRIDAARLRAALGLTPAEAALACALAEGDTLQSHAAKRGVSVETVRTLLRGAFRKTGCARQSELVALVLTLAA